MTVHLTKKIDVKVTLGVLASHMAAKGEIIDITDTFVNERESHLATVPMQLMWLLILKPGVSKFWISSQWKILAPY